jgi:hypothetical protein
MSNTTVREFIRNYENGMYSSPSMGTMIEAGWYDWFCEDEELKPRLDAMFPKVKQIAMSSKIGMDRMYVFFKNNCPLEGNVYDDFRFCEMRNGDVVYTVVPASGHKKTEGQSELWGRENDFKEALAKGTWDDIANFFGVQDRHEIKYKVNGITYIIGEFGKSTQNEFDEAVANLPLLIKFAREGNIEAGQTANDLLWTLANESFNTRQSKDFECLYTFGKTEAVQ